MPTVVYRHDADWNGNEIKNFTLEKLASAPSHAAGRMYYDTDDGRFFGSTGISWKRLDNLNATETENLFNQGGNGNIPLIYSETIGDGINTSYNVAHGFATQAVIVSVRNISTNEFESVAITTPDPNTVTVEFDTAPAEDSYEVIVIGRKILA